MRGQALIAVGAGITALLSTGVAGASWFGGTARDGAVHLCVGNDAQHAVRYMPGFRHCHANETELTINGGGGKGATGSTGRQGPKGATGARGAAGPQGLAGAVGPAGTQGLKGDNGTNGTTILNGTVAPVDGQGSAGDFYLNTTTDELYGPKTANGWGTPTSLKGAAGASGADNSWKLIALPSLSTPVTENPNQTNLTKDSSGTTVGYPAPTTVYSTTFTLDHAGFVQVEGHVAAADDAIPRCTAMEGQSVWNVTANVDGTPLLSPQAWHGVSDHTNNVPANVDNAQQAVAFLSAGSHTLNYVYTAGSCDLTLYTTATSTATTTTISHLDSAIYEAPATVSN